MREQGEDRESREDRAEKTQPPGDERSREEPAAATRPAPEARSGDPDPPERSEWWRRGFAPGGKRHLRAGALIGVLTAVLGFAIAVQVHSNSSSDSLQNLREDDLIRILDDQNARAERLNQQIADLQNTLDQLRRSGNSNQVAQEQAQRELQSLQVLLGTVAATGPGVAVTISDPQRNLKAEDLLDVVEELRGAGAEAMQFGPVRVTTSTSFSDAGDGVRVDGQAVAPPYQVVAIGDPKTLDTALNIPGGVAATARNAGGEAQIDEQQRVDIPALSTLRNPKYATPTGR
ncbi:MAG TPA: DUF881 domain-containing protein [Jatrophihabitantaceae bacterium]|jgi:uncharacterized protein YlxW (UPF0749 family)